MNSWLKPASGSWEEMQWSLGVLPGTGQSIMITNEGSKEITISAATVASAPSSLAVNSITLSSALNSQNVLLLTNLGLQNPFTMNSGTVSSNTALRMAGSALQLTGGSGAGLSIGGEFYQDDFSAVAGSQVDIGYIGPGVYNLLTGTLAVSHAWIGGPFHGVFNQGGGSNGTGIVHLDAGGKYFLSGGDFSAGAYFNVGSVFRQNGGRLNSGLGIWQGTYLLEGGSSSGGLSLPAFDGFSANGKATMVQTGGTNYSAIQLGYYGWGYYTLSNGVSLPGSFAIQARGSGQQWGGTQIIAGAFSVVTDYIARDAYYPGSYSLNAGYFSAGALQVGGHFTQNGGTNLVGGDIVLNGIYGDLELNGGLLCSQNTMVWGSWVGGYVQSGGVQVITNQLTISGSTLYGWKGFVLNGGELVVSNILLNAGARLVKNGGTISQSGVITVTAADLYFGSGTHHLGPVLLQTDAAAGNNSTIHLATNSPCLLRFGASSGLAWEGTATLTIENWSGALSGGGAQQLVFGTSSAGLSATQGRQVLFHNPAGFAPGYYPAQILSTGELVPGASPASSAALALTLRKQPDGSMEITVRAPAGMTYALETSADLAAWQPWTNVTSSANSASAIDLDAPKLMQRFYRATLVQ